MRFIKWHFSEWPAVVILIGMSFVTIGVYLFGTTTEFLFTLPGFIAINGGIMYGNYRYFKRSGL